MRDISGRVIRLSKNNGVKKTKLEQLAEWKKRPFLDKMLDDGVSPNQCHKWLLENGFEISMPMVYKYAQRRKEAIVKDIQLNTIMDKRTTNGGHSTSKKRKRRTKKTIPTTHTREQEQEERKQDNLTVNKVQTDLELLDAVIQKGWETLSMMEAIDPSKAIQAIKLKNEITGGAHNGLTTYGLEEIRLREAARETAMTAILLEFIPEDKHEEVLKRMDEATKEFYESIGLGDEYKKLEEDMESVVNEA